MSAEPYGREFGHEQLEAEDGLMEVIFGFPDTFDHFDVDVALIGLREFFAERVIIEQVDQDHAAPVEDYRKFFVAFHAATLLTDRIDTLKAISDIIESYKEQS